MSKQPSPAEAPNSARATPDLVLRGARRKGDANWQEYDTTVLLFRGKNDTYLTGFVLAGGVKHQVIAHINERKPDTSTGEVKPNFIVLSELVSREGEEDKWNQIGHGNAMNRRSDGKPVYFDELLFKVGDETLNARVTKNVDAALHRQLGFEQARVDRPAANHAREGGPSSKESDSRPAPSQRVA